MAIIYRQDKGASLTYAEMDNNFYEIDQRLSSSDLCRVGFMTYSNSSSTPVSVTGGSTWYQLLNDGLGTYSTDDYASTGITQLWNTSTNALDFTQLEIGDQYELAMYMSITTTTANQELDFRIRTGIGSAGEFALTFHHAYYKTAGTYPLQINFPLYVGTSYTKANPGRLEVKSADNASVLLTDLYIKTYIRGGV